MARLLGEGGRGDGEGDAPGRTRTTGVDRRRFLGAGMTALAGFSMAGAGDRPALASMPPQTPEEPEVTEPYIDAHSHVWTPDLDRYPLADGFARSDMQPPSFTAEELLATCRPLGVGRVNLIQMSYYGFDNSYMLDMIAAYPGRFVGTAIIDPAGPDPASAMAELRPRGVVAFRIQPQVLGLPVDRWLDHPGYEAMFTQAAEGRQAISCLIGPDALPEVARMCGRHPDAPVIIDHLARIGVDGTIRDADIETLCGLARHPNLYVKIGAFYALSPAGPPYLDLAPMIRRVLDAFGPDRCMWESDCPFQVVDHTYEDSLSLIRDRLDFLTDSDRDQLLAGTAEALLFRPRPLN
ncbi:amidohydrolase family protein [Tautonia plasticadhaerens]|uniref:4-sulfomuconolactone hydrolase n=1 Tax=Tautonia plasticadhaerens TaxID=2527974 RepID=A0A518HA39_9BACT|nr:amidohydrolase family protein [Tautonia plasticadhaerens]QDV37720.1 4-sulfomuconolactone hydrolase [Tautonia plasticadhaerens]